MSITPALILPFFGTVQHKKTVKQYRGTEAYVSSQREDSDLRQAVFIHSALLPAVG